MIIFPYKYRTTLISITYMKKVSEYDQEIPHLITSDQPQHSEEKAQKIISYKTSGRQLK